MSPAYSPVMEGTDAPIYVQSCAEMLRTLATQERQVKKNGAELVISGLRLGEKGGLAQPHADYDRGTVETFRTFVEHIGDEGLAPLVETEVVQPKEGVIGKHTFLVREPWVPDPSNQAQYVRLEIEIRRENEKTGRLKYDATLTHSCRPDEMIKAANGIKPDENLWVELSRLFAG